MKPIQARIVAIAMIGLAVVLPVCAWAGGELTDEDKDDGDTTTGPFGFVKDTRGVEIDHDFTERTTFIVTPDGKISAVFSTADDKVSPADHVMKSLTAVQQLKGTK